MKRQEFIDSTQKVVCGFIRLKLFKGNIIIEGRKSENFSLYEEYLATFEDDKGTYDQKDAEGFIKLNALRLKNKHKKVYFHKLKKALVFVISRAMQYENICFKRP